MKAALPRKIRSLRQFAEEDVVVRHGRFDVPFRIATQPFSGCVFDEMDRGHWYEMYFTGPSQSAKTTIAFLIPAAHAIAELRENIVLGIPLDEMVDDKIRGDLFGMMRRSPRLAPLLPQSGASGRSGGAGARGGKIKEKVVFANGIEAKPITCGGSDQAKAGYPVRIVLVTEAAGWSKSSATSTESDRLRQLKARLRSHTRSQRRLIVEGTLTIPEELPWSARGEDTDPTLRSSRTRLETPCPHCDGWILPDREQLRGWQDARSEQEAADGAYWACPRCDHPITDDERRRANQSIRAVHHGQRVNEHGEVVGELPATHTLWIQWKAYHNCLLSTADIAVDEWKAAQIDEGTEERENAERELCQFVHSRVFRSALATHEPLTSVNVRQHKTEWPRGILPADTVAVAIGSDPGDWTGHWAAVAERANGAFVIPAYGFYDVKREPHETAKERIGPALSAFREAICEAGFHSETGQIITPCAVWIDFNYLTEEIADWCRQWGSLSMNRYRPCRGRGQSVTYGLGRGVFNGPKRVTRSQPKVGREWFAEVNYARRVLEYTFNADYWKGQVHAGFRAAVGEPGALSLFRPDTPNEHAKISNHICNEQLLVEWKLGEGVTRKYVRKGDQHLLDCLAMALAALQARRDGLEGVRSTLPPRGTEATAASPTLRRWAALAAR